MVAPRTTDHAPEFMHSASKGTFLWYYKSVLFVYIARIAIEVVDSRSPSTIDGT